MTYYLYVVRGSGSLPLDMLRYDECWPRNSGAVDAIQVDGEDKFTIRNVELRGVREPTKDRWGSFGWTVLERVAKVRA